MHVNRRKLIAAAVIALLVGACSVITGEDEDTVSQAERAEASEAEPTPEPEETPEPEVIVEEVEVIKEVEVVKEVEVEVPVEVTPQACLDALDTAEQGFGFAAVGMDLSSQALTTAAEGVDAILAMDIAGIDAATAKIERLTAEMVATGPELEAVAADYQRQSAECRS